jgi:hypothetical protein
LSKCDKERFECERDHFAEVARVARPKLLDGNEKRLGQSVTKASINRRGDRTASKSARGRRILIPSLIALGRAGITRAIATAELPWIFRAVLDAVLAHQLSLAQTEILYEG